MCSRMQRLWEFGVRFCYEGLWTGYEKVQDKTERSPRA